MKLNNNNNYDSGSTRFLHVCRSLFKSTRVSHSLLLRSFLNFKKLFFLAIFFLANEISKYDITMCIFSHTKKIIMNAEIMVLISCFLSYSLRTDQNVASSTEKNLSFYFLQQWQNTQKISPKTRIFIHKLS